jgi:hypothetical protein
MNTIAEAAADGVVPPELAVVVPPRGPYGRSGLEADVLELVRRLDAETNGQITFAEFCRIAPVSRSTVTRWFGSWLGLRQRAGLPPSRRTGSIPFFSRPLLVEKLRQLPAMGRQLTEREFCQLAGVSTATIEHYCGGWRQLVAEASPAPTPAPPKARTALPLGPPVRLIDLCLDLHRLVCLLARFPTLDEIDEQGRFPAATHLQAFGTHAAMEQHYERFGERMRDLLANSPDPPSGPLTPARGGAE